MKIYGAHIAALMMLKWKVFDRDGWRLVGYLGHIEAMTLSKTWKTRKLAERRAKRLNAVWMRKVERCLL